VVEVHEAAGEAALVEQLEPDLHPFGEDALAGTDHDGGFTAFGVE